jgi:DNA-binding transcriptional LysR family regulator
MKIEQWNLIRTFAAVAETGSLSGASRQLGLTQPAVSRHIDVLEDQLRLQLFQRSREGMRLTPKGADLVSVADEMQTSATSFARIATGLEAEIGGTVRISANDVLGVSILPALLAEFQQQHPDIEIELGITNVPSNLLQRDADIAVRMFRPEQSDLVAQKVADLPLGFYAHPDYLDRHGRPKAISDFMNHRLIGFDRDTAMLKAAKDVGLNLKAENFAFRCDNILAQIQAIRAGVGIGVGHTGLAVHWPDVEPVLEHFKLEPLELWIVCHADVHHNNRIRRTVDFLSENLRTPYARYDGAS